MLQKRGLSEFLLKYPRVAPIAAFVLAMLATLLVANSAEQASRVEQRLATTERISALGHDIERRATATQAYLVAGAALFGSGIEVDQPTFDRFAAALQNDKGNQGIIALGWSVRLPAAGLPQNRPWPRAPKPSATVDAVTYIAPLDATNRLALGDDMRSEPARRAAMDRAALTGKAAVTGLIQLAGDGTAPSRSGFVIFLPVYGNAVSSTARGEIKGYIYAVLRADDLIRASVLHQAAGPLNIEIYDTAETSPQLLYRLGQPILSGQAIARKIAVADHHWIIKSSAPPISSLSKISMLILLAGLIVAALLLFIVRLAIQQALFDRQQLRVRQEQDSIRATLTRELNHRVKNTLANVLSILSLSRRKAHDLDSFVATFDGRVRALSATHNLLMHTSWGPASIVEVIQTEMAPYFESDRRKIVLDGPDAVVAPNDALSLGLLVHELVTNAAKYGALSTAAGTLSLTWSITSAQQILFDWRELGGPVPAQDRHRGFGSDLIEKVISRELRSDIKLEFPPSGAHCTFAVPIRSVTAFALREP